MMNHSDHQGHVLTNYWVHPAVSATRSRDLVSFEELKTVKPSSLPRGSKKRVAYIEDNGVLFLTPAEPMDIQAQLHKRRDLREEGQQIANTKATDSLYGNPLQTAFAWVCLMICGTGAVLLFVIAGLARWGGDKAVESGPDVAAGLLEALKWLA